MDHLPKLNKNLDKFKIRTIFKETIEPEEILLDATKSSDLEEQKIEVPIRRRIFRLFGAIILGAFLVLTGQAAYLQIWNSGYFKNLAEKNRTRSLPIFAARGIIYDKNMKQLVFNAPSFNLVVSLPDLPRDAAVRREVIKKAADISGAPQEEILKEIGDINSKYNSSAIVIDGLEHKKMLEIQAELNELPGFRIEQNISRQYVSGPQYSHILGYLGKLTGRDIVENPDYFLTEKIGKNGLEAFYEKILRGTPGQRLLEVDSMGRLKGEVSEQKAKDGQGLVLAIDSRLQELLYGSLSRALQSRQLKRAAAVAIDPSSGGVLAMASFPSFDNNLFGQNFSSKDYGDLANNPTQPLFNRVVSGQYPPGSTVKPLIGAAALQEKIVTPGTSIYDPGELALMNQYDSSIIYRFADWKAHGTVNIYSAIAQSCDVYFYTVGGGYGNIKGLGMGNLEKYFKLFGFGNILGIDLPGEGSGLVPSERWKQQVKKEDWYTGDTYHISIGQGDLLATPLQMAAATAAILNGGKVLKPHVVDKIIDSDKNVIVNVEPKIISRNFIDEANFAVIKKAMRQTVTDGSALLLNDLPVAVGAKTGTAQVAGNASPNAWGVVFAPYDNPQMVLVVLVEKAGEGSQVAMPVIKEVLKEYYKQ
ncbi:MAG: penicillin-binding protein 2 [Candidatus Portnoybacteria bacterium]|nr:penicillin-binding protein 2 [Candidatus Portnoybacteria bacterium]MDD4982405.1 penicillin-binding protein 2 [Candidatus Portnoybacteria bacterium]